jgi:hypothetical protein
MQTTMDAVRVISKEAGIKDADLGADIYALIRLKGGGIPNDPRVDQLCRSIAQQRKITGSAANQFKWLVKKRVMMLTSMAKSAYFRSVSRHTALNPIQMLEKFLSTTISLAAKAQQGKCTTCALLNSCQFGKAYHTKVLDIAKLPITDVSEYNTIHADCPSRPDIDNNLAFTQAMQTLSGLSGIMNVNGQGMGDNNAELLENGNTDDLDEEDEIQPGDVNEPKEDMILPNLKMGGSPGTPSAKDYSVSGLIGEKVIRVTEDSVARLTGLNLAIYNLGGDLSQLMGKSKSPLLRPTPAVSKDMSSSNIKSAAEISQVLPSQLALPEAVKTVKLAKNQLLKKQNNEPDKLDKILYILLDVSYSMNSTLGGNGARGLGAFARRTLAQVYCLALLKNCEKAKTHVYFQAFASGVDRARVAKNATEFELLTHFVTNQAFQGGGTNIPDALMHAMTTITTAKDDLSCAEVLMITDVEQQISPQDQKNIMGMTHKLYTTKLGRPETPRFCVLDIGGESTLKASAPKLGAAHMEANLFLRQVASKYYLVDPKEADLNKMVSLV